MALFNFGKKKEEVKAAPCCCAGEEPKVEETACCCAPKNKELPSCCCGEPVEGICCIKVLGSGCKNCHTLLDAAKEAVSRMGIDVEVEFVTDMEKIMEYGVMSMPALVVNEQVVSMGRVLKAADVEKLLGKYEG